VRVLRTSNAYNFRDPGSPDSSKSDFPSGTPNQASFSPLEAASGGERTGRSGRKGAFDREAWRNPPPDGVFEAALLPV
jgi:hypothetical protein